MMTDFKSKYLKYKNKYLELKQKGGYVYFIGNYTLNTKQPALSEAITSGTLSPQMTQHGLGTGIYGFIDWTEHNKGADAYRKPENKLTIHILKRPIILENSWKEDGETRTDLANFTFLSMNLNILCYTIFTMQLNINILTDEELKTHVMTIFSNNGFDPYIYDWYKGIPNVHVTIQEIIYVVRTFLNDYTILMSTPEIENYILMPINYLAYIKGYDGVLNKNDDSGTTGSIKYCFGREYEHCQKARGFIPKFKRIDPLNGSLIFTAKIKN